MTERLSVPIIWGNVPQRNRHFTGREDLLAQVRAQVTDTTTTALLPHALRGYGGVGKTQLAIEYIYRHTADYDVVWWIPADEPGLMRSTLARLAPRLGIHDIPQGQVADAVDAVRDALRRGQPYERWLLVFDNADQPEDLRDLIPYGPGHTLVTSRNHRWESAGASLEVNVFNRAESLEFLGKRVQGSPTGDADLLADRLGDLPLALEQAGAFMSETAMPVDVYLRLLDDEAGKILAANQPLDYPVPVAAAWSMSVTRLRESMPQAMELLHRCAYFGANPIPLELLERGRFVLEPSALRNTLRDPYELARAIREIGRYSLARIDNHRRTLQMHRIIQALVRDELSPEQRGRVRDEVHQLLVAADPGLPDDVANWPSYAELVGHTSGISESTAPEVRTLTLNIVRYLIMFGDYAAAKEAVETTLSRWRDNTPADDPNILSMLRHDAHLRHELGDYDAAYERSSELLPRMRAALGDEHPETLRTMNLLAGMLHNRGEFQAALELNEEALTFHHQVFGPDHPYTFNIINNLVRNYSHASRYEDALRLSEEWYRQARDYYGRDDHPRAVYALDALARSLRIAGRYHEALERGEQARRLYEELVRQRVIGDHNRELLLNARNLSVIRRKAGDYPGALELAEEAYGRLTSTLGAEHPDTLAIIVTLGNARRLLGQREGTADLFVQATEGYVRRLGSDHPYTQAGQVNLAILHRDLGNGRAARDLLEKTRSDLRRTLGPDHHYTLTTEINLATVLADAGEIEAAREMDQATAAKLRDTLGPDHPHTIICTLNLALDLAATESEDEAAALVEETLEKQRRVLGKDHPDVRAAEDRSRLTVDFQPQDL